MSRKTLFLVLMTFALLMAVSLGAVAAQEDIRITLVVNGVLGDKSFFDSAQRGVDRHGAGSYRPGPVARLGIAK